MAQSGFLIMGGIHYDFSVSERCLGAFLINSEKRLLTSSCLSVRVYQRGSHWTDFLEIWY